jgi:hypothetical protein
MGIQTILEEDVFNTKQPRFDTNPRFDTSVFGERFDFFLAYSIWTHASKRQILTMLEMFLRDSSREAAFLTTYMPATWRYQDYRGANWNGTSHESIVPGCIRHRFSWIKTECSRRGLTVFKLGRDATHDQYWLEIRRNGTGPFRRGHYPFWLRKIAAPLLEAKRMLLNVVESH